MGTAWNNDRQLDHRVLRALERHYTCTQGNIPSSLVATPKFSANVWILLIYYEILDYHEYFFCST